MKGISLILEIDGNRFAFLGDPHLGRPFRNGVPLHRMGERERLQHETFRSFFQECTVQNIRAGFCVGDLFNSFTVSNNVVMETRADIDQTASTVLPFYFLGGNHDDKRDIDHVSSLAMLSQMRFRHDAIHFVRLKPEQLHFEGTKVVMMPWHPVKTAAEMVEEYADLVRDADLIIGHWDVDARLAGTENYIPAARLVELGVKLAVTGHDHVKREMEIDGLTVHVTGSMQPYSFSEDKTGDLYVTVPADEARAALATDPETYRDKCLRVVGDWDDLVPECLMFRVKLLDQELDDEVLMDVQMEEFSMADLWTRNTEALPEHIQLKLKEKFADLEGELDL